MAGQRAVYRFDPVSFVDYSILTGAFAGSGSENDTLIQVYADSGLKKLISSNDNIGSSKFSEVTVLVPIILWCSLQIRIQRYTRPCM